MVTPTSRMATAGILAKGAVYMQMIQDVVLLLQKKLALFLEFERYTNLLTGCDMDDMADYITKRAELANEIDNVTDQISRLSNTITVSPPVADILSNSCNFSEVPPQWQLVFSEAQHVRAVISRCTDLNQQALERMIGLRDQLKDRIVEAKNTPRLIKYISSSGVVQQEQGISVKDQRI